MSLTGLLQDTPSHGNQSTTSHLEDLVKQDL